jgi:hypothetical protein
MIEQLKGRTRFDWRPEGLVCEITLQAWKSTLTPVGESRDEGKDARQRRKATTQGNDARQRRKATTQGNDARQRVKRNRQANHGACLLSDGFFDNLKKTVASAPSGGTGVRRESKACAEHNITVTQEFVRDLSYAKNIREICFEFRWNSCARN